MWTEEQTACAFCTAVHAFLARRPGDVGASHFTKDDPLAVTIVAAAANLRARSFGIPEQSEFEAKGMAGNIIHAIATTNAITAGYITIEALKVLAGCQSDCRTTFLTGVRHPCRRWAAQSGIHAAGGA
jgi:ubiquitin-like 1-activating enzyme E1 B